MTTRWPSVICQLPHDQRTRLRRPVFVQPYLGVGQKPLIPEHRDKGTLCGVHYCLPCGVMRVSRFFRTQPCLGTPAR